MYSKMGDTIKGQNLMLAIVERKGYGDWKREREGESLLSSDEGM